MGRGTARFKFQSYEVLFTTSNLFAQFFFHSVTDMLVLL
jgi:hypothetical protein